MDAGRSLPDATILAGVCGWNCLPVPLLFLRRSLDTASEELQGRGRHRGVGPGLPHPGRNPWTADRRLAHGQDHCPLRLHDGPVLLSGGFGVGYRRAAESAAIRLFGRSAVRDRVWLDIRLFECDYGALLWPLGISQTERN